MQKSIKILVIEELKKPTTLISRKFSRSDKLHDTFKGISLRQVMNMPK
jgi:hypothetical protein